MAKMYEDVTRRIRELQAEGKAVTRFSMVNTLDNFNLQTAGCLQCLGVFTTFTTTFEEHYPETLDQMILVNSKLALNHLEFPAENSSFISLLFRSAIYL